MKIFLIGMPGSGRTAVAHALASWKIYRTPAGFGSEAEYYCYVHATEWLKDSFKGLQEDRKFNYNEYHVWLLNFLNDNPNIISDYLKNIIDSGGKYPDDYVIDGLFSPKDFINLFDYKKDMVVFLNRTNNDSEYKDYENIGVSVIKDYCFWLASADLLDNQRWLEYNFQIPGEEFDYLKTLGSKNSVFIVKSLNKAIEHLKGILIKKV